MLKRLLYILLLCTSTSSAAGFEYATFYATSSQYEWLGPKNQRVLSNSFSQVVMKLGCKLPVNASEADYVDLLNCVGAQGWELVTVVNKPATRAEQWVFKRSSK